MFTKKLNIFAFSPILFAIHIGCATYPIESNESDLESISNPMTGTTTDGGDPTDPSDSMIECWPDNDDDGYGAGESEFYDGVTCPMGTSSNGNDCDDDDSAAHAQSSCYGGTDADGDGYSTGTSTSTYCGSCAHNGKYSYGNDCNDANSSLHAKLTCYGGKDKDGDGYSTYSSPKYVCATSCSSAGYYNHGSDCDDYDANEQVNITCYATPDSDGDGYCATSSTTNVCAKAGGICSDYGKCDKGDDIDDTNSDATVGINPKDKLGYDPSNPNNANNSTIQYNDPTTLLKLKGYYPWEDGSWENLNYLAPSISILSDIRDLSENYNGKSYDYINDNMVDLPYWENWCTEMASIVYQDAGLEIDETDTSGIVDWFSEYMTEITLDDLMEYAGVSKTNGVYDLSTGDKAFIRTLLVPGTYVRFQWNAEHQGHSGIILDSDYDTSGNLYFITQEGNQGSSANPDCDELDDDDPDNDYRCSYSVIKYRYLNADNDGDGIWDMTDFGLLSGKRKRTIVNSSSSSGGYNSSYSWDLNLNTWWYSKSNTNGEIYYKFDDLYGVRAVYIHTDSVYFPKTIEVYASDSDSCEASSSTSWTKVQTTNVSFGGKYTIPLNGDDDDGDKLERVNMRCMKLKFSNRNSTYNKMYEIRAYR